MSEKYKYFESLKSGGNMLTYLEEMGNNLKSVDKWWDKPEIQLSVSLIDKEIKDIKDRSKKYKLTEGKIDPRGEELHITKDFSYLMDLDSVNGSTKYHAGIALMELNDYYRYTNRLHIDSKKYKAHRRSMLKLDPDMNLPKTPKEILISFEDRTKQDPDGYRQFLNSFGNKRRPKRNPLEKFLQKIKITHTISQK